MRRVVFVLAALAGLVLVMWPADAQVPITSSTTSTTRKPTTTTTKPPSTTSTTKAPATGPTTTRRPSTTTTTAPQRTTTTIATPAPAPTTTAVPTPVSRHTGDFSPVFTWLTVLGLVAFVGLLALQWFLTRPGRQGWTL